MELLTEAPRPSAFVPLSEHQSTTPVSFHSGPAVLHYYSDRCQVIVLEEELQNAPVLLNLVTKASAPAHSNERESADDANGHNPAQKTLEEIDIWVTSEYVGLADGERVLIVATASYYYTRTLMKLAFPFPTQPFRYMLSSHSRRQRPRNHSRKDCTCS